MRQRRASSDRPGNRPDESLHFQDPVYTYLTRISDAVWKTSSRCAGNGSCVEVAKLTTGHIAVRDGMNSQPDKVVAFTREEWRDFLASVRAGDFGSA
jgi:Domain of unknown function (DUF397)